MPDQYANFAELRSGETEGADYFVRIARRESVIAIIAPHGGYIEPHTSEVAAAIASDMHSLYCFEGLRNRPHGDLHITSTLFDEPHCLELLSRCRFVVAVHGMAGFNKRLDVGGLDFSLRDTIGANLREAGFTSEVVTTGNRAAASPRNICNKGLRGKGVQLEIDRGLREALVNQREDLHAFATSVQKAISSQLSN